MGEANNNCKDRKGVMLTFDDAITMAKGCFDYMGGYHHEADLEVYHHGIQTVINVLEAAQRKGLDNTQVGVVHAIGKRIQGESE